MRFLVVSTDYPDFLHWMQSRYPAVHNANYEEQLRLRSATLFGGPHDYTQNLKLNGVEAHPIYLNNPFIQKAWAAEFAPDLLGEIPSFDSTTSPHFRFSRRVLEAGIRRITRTRADEWQYRVLSEQLRHYAPDVVINHDPVGIDPDFWRERADSTALLIGQLAAPLPNDDRLNVHDLMISSLPNLVTRFKREGIKAEFHRLGFNQLTAPPQRSSDPPVDVSFVGSISAAHTSRIQFLEDLSAELETFEIWGQGFESLPLDSPLRTRWRGPVWGHEMFATLSRSKVTVNIHIDLAGDYCNNSRMFEATGAGTCLLTDRKSNLHEFFDEGTEVRAFETSAEAIVNIRDLLMSNAWKRIGDSGQKRTLSDHTYRQRMAELVSIVESYLR